MLASQSTTTPPRPRFAGSPWVGRPSLVDNKDTGDNLPGLYSLVATCELNGVNPIKYLADVLKRINDHPNSRIDDLLPPILRGPPGSSLSANSQAT